MGSVVHRPGGGRPAGSGWPTRGQGACGAHGLRHQGPVPTPCAARDRAGSPPRQRIVQAIGREPQRAPDGAAVHYERHWPEQTTLYRLVQQHGARFIARTGARTGCELPRFIRDPFGTFLECASCRTAQDSRLTRTAAASSRCCSLMPAMEPDAVRNRRSAEGLRHVAAARRRREEDGRWPKTRHGTTASPHQWVHQPVGR